MEVGGVHPGTVSSNVYSNPFFGLSLEIPEGWQVADSRRAEALRTKTKQQFAKQDPSLAQIMRGDEVDSRVLVMIEREAWKGTSYHRSVSVLSTNVSQRPGEPSADAFLKFVGMISKERGLPSEYGDTLEQVTLGGKQFWRAYFTQNSSIVWHAAHFATIEKSHVLQLILLSPDEDGLHGLEAMVRTLHFDPWAQQDSPDVIVAEIKVAGPGRSITSTSPESARIELDTTPAVPCPTDVRFTASIKLSHAPLTLSYWWERSDGKTTREKLVDIPAEGDLFLNLTDLWKTGTARESSWVLADRLHVRSGDVDFASESGRFLLNCRGQSK